MLCTAITTGAKIGTLVGYVTCLITKSIIPLMVLLAIVAFVWGVIQFFIFGADEEAKREKGKQFIVWGLVALAVMLSVMGLVRIVQRSFGILPGIGPAGTSGGDGSGGGGGGEPVDPCTNFECL